MQLHQRYQRELRGRNILWPWLLPEILKPTSVHNFAQSLQQSPIFPFNFVQSFTFALDFFQFCCNMWMAGWWPKIDGRTSTLYLTTMTFIFFNDPWSSQ